MFQDANSRLETIKIKPMNIDLNPLEMQAITLALRMYNLRVDESLEWHEDILNKINNAYPLAIDEALSRIEPENHEKYLTLTKNYIDNIEDVIEAEVRTIASFERLQSRLSK